MQADIAARYALPMPARSREPSNTCLARATRPERPLPIHSGGTRTPTRALCSALFCAFLLCANAVFGSMQPGRRAVSVDAITRASGPKWLPAYIPRRTHQPRSRGADGVTIFQCRMPAQRIWPLFSTLTSKETLSRHRTGSSATGDHIPTDAALNFSAGRPRGSSATIPCGTCGNFCSTTLTTASAFDSRILRSILPRATHHACTHLPTVSPRDARPESSRVTPSTPHTGISMGSQQEQQVAQFFARPARVCRPRAINHANAQSWPRLCAPHPAPPPAGRAPPRLARTHVLSHVLTMVTPYYGTSRGCRPRILPRLAPAPPRFPRDSGRYPP